MGETGAKRYFREAVLLLLHHVVFVLEILLGLVAGAREVHGGKGARHHGRLLAPIRGHAGGARGAGIYLDQRGAPLPLPQLGKSD